MMRGRRILVAWEAEPNCWEVIGEYQANGKRQRLSNFILTIIQLFIYLFLYLLKVRLSVR
jgi:hypothetical protein